MALAFNEPNKIKEIRSEGDIKQQAEELGLETEPWF